MGFELIAILAATIGMLVMMIGARLKFIDEKYDKLIEKANQRINEIDQRLDPILQKRNSDKLLVLSITSQWVAIKRIEDDIETNSVSNSGKAIYFDYATIGSLGFTAILTFIGSLFTEFIVILGVITAIMVILSAISFLNHISDIQSFKKKLKDDNTS